MGQTDCEQTCSKCVPYSSPSGVQVYKCILEESSDSIVLYIIIIIAVLFVIFCVLMVVLKLKKRTQSSGTKINLKPSDLQIKEEVLDFSDDEEKNEKKISSPKGTNTNENTGRSGMENKNISSISRYLPKSSKSRNKRNLPNIPRNTNIYTVPKNIRKNSFTTGNSVMSNIFSN